MEYALKPIFDAIVWILVPSLLGSALWSTYSHAQKSSDSRANDSGQAGFMAGFILFIIIVVYQIGVFLKTSFPEGPIYKGFDLWLAFSSAILAYLIFSGGKKIIPIRLKGWGILGASFFIFYSLFHYLFIRTFNEFLLSLVLGLAFGIFVHNIVSPPTKEFPKFGGGGHH
ncbi:MAG: hypothetical protein NUV53_03695 [Patescibacteria group bacterium]|nr:hypothetical protein [Patescibacteria group bacterium]